MPITGSTAATIANSVEGELRAGGGLAPGDQLPPVRVLAAALAVSPATVAAAYKLLRQRGVVETAGRAGTRVRSRPSSTPRNEPGPAARPGARDLSTGEPDPLLLPAPRFPDPATWRPLYNHPPLLPQFEAAAQKALGGVPTDHLAAVSGALDGIERALLAHLRPGDRVAVEDPGWARLFDLLAALGLVPHPVPLDDDGPLPEAVADALKAGCRAVVVTSRAQNPTGAAVSAERAAELRSVLAEHPGTLLIEDDHGNNIAGPSLATAAGSTAHWAYVRSASKAYGPDLRCAAVAGDQVTVERITGRQRLGPGWVSHALQYATAAAWTHDGEAVRRARDTYTTRRTMLLDALTAEGFEAHGKSGINVWLPVADETAAVVRLLDRDIVVAPGKRFRIRSGPAVRITTATLTEEDVARIVAALRAPGRAHPV